MKEFQRKLEVSRPGQYQIFKSIEVGGYELSIQGSESAYCHPRESLPPDIYTEMELAIFKGGEWLNVAKSSTFKAFPRYRELKERADGWFPNKGDCGGRVVFGYVPVDLIDDLHQYLKET